MSLLSLKSISHDFGGPQLLDQVDLEIHEGERIGLLGRNGCGKSTLMKIIAGQIEAESGDIARSKGIRVTFLRQDVPDDLAGSVGEYLRRVALESPNLKEWEIEESLAATVKSLGLEVDTEANSLSAGAKRRLLLAAALIVQPEVLLLDEPTNHLDIEAIQALESTLVRSNLTVLFVTHDRAFMRRISTRIIDLDRGQLTSYSCDYDTYLERKEADLKAEGEQRAQFDKKLKQEEAWIRRGVQGRRARNMGRVRALREMREDRRNRLEQTGRVRAQVQEAQSSGRLVMEAQGLSFAFDKKSIVDDFEVSVMRGDRIGLVGANGVGKTTLIRLLLGQLEPQAGSVRHGTKLELAYFDQLHQGLDPKKTPLENVGEGSDKIVVNGQSRHVIGYLGDFLFTPEQVRSSITKLSGGEKNRLQLARMLARPSNLLILDEPTNDLDVETLELLEELLFEYKGTIIVVSHDREFLNNVVTSTIYFDGFGNARPYDGGYEDLQRQLGEKHEENKVEAKKTAKKEKPKKNRPRKLSFNEKNELEALPDKIDALEEEKAALGEKMAEPEFYRQDHAIIKEATARLEAIDQELEALVERWAELEEIANN